MSSGKDSHRKKSVGFLIPLLLIFGISLFAWFHGSHSIDWTWTEDSLTVTDPGGETFSVDFADVITVTLEPQNDLGECLRGDSTRAWIYGVWKNERWGQYRLCAAADSTSCIVFQATDGFTVISYESEQTTRALFESACDLVSSALARLS